MTYFAPYIDASGLHMPTYEERLQALCDSYRSIFGQDAELSPAVPDYQLLSVFAKALDDASALMLQVYHSRNPAYAQGQALDLLLPMYGMTRRGATCSTVTLTLSGTAGTAVPAGTAFADASGQIWKTDEAVTIQAAGAGGSSGIASVRATCQTPGAIYATAGTITAIVSPVSGLSAVTNPSGSSIGLKEETDAELRKRISSSMAGRGNTILDALTAAIAGIPNVQKSRIYVNDADARDANNIPGHTIACVVLGGDPQTIGKTIYNKKAPGVGTYGTTTVAFTGDDGQGHQVQFSRPTARMTYFMVSLTPLAGFDEEAVKAAITAEIRAIVGEIPIGEALNIPSMFGRLYASTGSLASTFVLNSVQASAAATAHSPAVVTTGLLEQAWDERLAIPSANGIQFTIG